MKLHYVRQFIVITLIELMLMMPILPQVVSLVDAASTPTVDPNSSTSCQQEVQSYAQDAPTTDPTVNTPDPSTSTQDLSEGAGDDLGPATVDPVAAQQNSSFNQKYFESITQKDHAWYNPDEKVWYFCSDTGVDSIYSLIQPSPEFYGYINTLSLPSPRITFKHEEDYWALVGEPCDKFIPSSNGHICAPNESNGTKHFTEPSAYFQNGKWDAPKADQRILLALDYLVTPLDQGGAGHELIDVSSVISDSKKDKEFYDASTKQQASSSDTATESSHYYDTDPNYTSKPRKVSRAFDIDEIDRIRLTTDVQKKHRIGGTSHTYTFKSFPIKAAWQTDAGIQKVGVPPVDVFTGAGVSFNSSLLQLLADSDLGDTIDPRDVNINNLGDLASNLGQSIIGQILNSPNGSLQGFDLGSTLENFGRATLAHDLGLAPGALSNTQGDVIENIGRATIENTMGFPRDSLQGKNSTEIYNNVGRRYLEDSIFKVAPGSLLTTPNFPINNQQDVELALGMGRIAKTFGVPLDQLRKSTLQDVKNGSVKLKGLFSTENGGFLDDKLYLTYVEADSNTHQDAFGFTKAQFDNPSNDVIEGRINLQTYYRMIGSRAMAAIDSFSPQVSNPGQTENLPGHSIATHFGGVVNVGADQLFPALPIILLVAVVLVVLSAP